MLRHTDAVLSARTSSIVKPLQLHIGLMGVNFVVFALLMVPILRSSSPYSLREMSLDTVSWLVAGVSLFGALAVRVIAGTFWDPRFFLFASMIAFNGGQYIGHLIVPDQPLFFERFTTYRIIPAAYFVATCLSAWTLGMLLMAPRHRIQQERVETPKRKWLTAFGWTFFAIGLLPTLLRLLGAIRTVAAGGYAALYQGEVQVGLGNIQAVLAAFFLPGVLFLLAAGGHSRRLRRFLLIAAFGVVGINFMLGHRSAAMLPLIAVLFVYHYRVRSVPRLPVILSFAALFGVVLPALAIARRTNGINLSLGSINDALRQTDNPALASLYEMGASGMTVIYSMMFIPPRPLDWGEPYLRSLLTVVPSTGGLNAGLQGGTYADWLIQRVDPIIAAQGGGLGFSAIAEVFANFGWHGGPVGFLGLSLLVHALLARFGNYRTAWHVAITAVFLYVLLFWARSEAVAMVRTLVWYALIPYLIVWAM